MKLVAQENNLGANRVQNSGVQTLDPQKTISLEK